MEVLDFLDLRAPLACVDPMASPAALVPQERRARLDLMASPACPVWLDPLEPLAQLVPLVPRAPRAPLAPRDPLDLLDSLGSPVLLVPLELMA